MSSSPESGSTITTERGPRKAELAIGTYLRRELLCLITRRPDDRPPCRKLGFNWGLPILPRATTIPASRTLHSHTQRFDFNSWKGKFSPAGKVGESSLFPGAGGDDLPIASLGEEDG